MKRRRPHAPDEMDSCVHRLGELAAALQTAANPICVTDASGRLRWANSAFRHATGHARDELSDLTLQALSLPLVPAHGGVAEPELLGTVVWRGWLRTLRKDGSDFIDDRTITPIRNDAGTVTGYVSVSVDVAAQKAIADSEMRYRALMETAADGVWVADAKGRLLAVNEAYARLSGYSREELLSMRIDKLTTRPACDIAAHIADMRRDGRKTFESRHRAKDGRIWPAEITVTYSPLGDGLLFVFVRDLTASRAADEALRASEERFELAMRGANDGVLDRDLVNDALYLSPQWKAMLGYEPHEVKDDIGDCIRLIVPEDRSRVVQAMTAFMTDPHAERLELEFRMRHRRGTEVHILSRTLLVRDAQGRPVRMVGTHQDITERRREQRERESLQRQLMQAQKMDALGQLTGGIAHDINNMLAAVMGFASLALERHVDDPDGKLARYLGEIVRVSERGRDLGAKMLAYSRMEAGQPARPRPLAPLVREVAGTLVAALPAGIELRLQLDDTLPPVALGDAELHQVLMNLVINARDAIGEHGVIEVGLRLAQGGGRHCASCHGLVRGRHVALSVADSGAGMGPEVQARIFEPFFTTKEIGKGTGLGLPVVQGLVHTAGGHLLICSEPGRGTTIELLFPPAHGVDDAPEPETAHAPAPAPGRRAWVVDDDPAVAMYIGDLLEANGCCVRRFTDPAQALAAFRADAGAMDVVVTDQTMPKLSGDGLAREMLALRPALPVILCTGFSDRIDEARAKAIGIRHFLRKPFDARCLLEAIVDCTG